MLYEEELTKQILGAVIEVHKQLGHGLLESAYQVCVEHEFSLRGLSFERQKELPVKYKGVSLDAGYRIDFIVAGKVIVELKAVSAIHPIHEAQLLTYMRLTGCKVGLIINFNVRAIKDGGIKRLVL